MTKVCTKCKVEKNTDQFHKGNNKSGFHSYCKECNISNRMKRYYTNQKQERVRANQWSANTRDDQRKYIIDYLNGHPCIDCGNNDIRVLEFDHKRDKKYTISTMMGSNSLQCLIDEIAKCEVRCANCHRIKTSKDFGYYRESKQRVGIPTAEEIRLDRIQ